MIDFLTNTKDLQAIIKASKEKGNLLITGVSGSVRAFIVASLVSHQNNKTIILTSNLLAATRYQEDLQALLSETRVLIYSIEENIAAEFSVASPENRYDRMVAIDWLLNPIEPGILIVPLTGIRQLLPDPAVWQESRLKLRLDQDIDRDALVDHLGDMGYIREAMVSKPGEFSVRGEIVDIFPLNTENPIRISFFDTVIEEMRFFDVDSQTKIETVEIAEILPAKDFFVSRHELKDKADALLAFADKQSKAIKNVEEANRAFTYYRDVAEQWRLGENNADLRYFADSVFDKTFSLMDYLPKNSQLVVDDYARILEEDHRLQTEEAAWVSHKVSDGRLLPNVALSKDIRTAMKSGPERRLFLSNFQKGLGNLKFNSVTPMQVRGITQFFSQMPLLQVEVARWLKQGYTIAIGVDDSERAVKLEQSLNDYEMQNVVNDGELVLNTINIIPLSVQTGFEMVKEKIVYIGEKDLFNKVKKKAPRKRQIANPERLKNYSQLELNDYVVHANHGIGQYVGMETIEVDGLKQDYLTVVYKDNSSLFIPVDQIGQLQKYVSADANREPKVNKLGGTDWKKTKSKVASQVEDIADELLELYATREAQEGYAFSPDTPEQSEFENAFPYTETDDQLRSSSEIKRDMEKQRPMDRLLVGDVGYGKTEVAMRAIYKCVSEGKQAAFLVPTTILAQQHYNSLIQRFEDSPFEVQMLSRFRTKAEQDKTIEGLAKGRVDIIVGTHRLLSKDIKFWDLGLLIVDEEQRFGVKDKERLKQIKANVDVLTLTATPIPRTLHMSMLGVRDLSVIETPPANRYPVQTYVMEWDSSAIRDAIEREMARGGQVFYLYNRVDNIEEKVAQIEMLVPDARVAYAHGQMTEVQLENVMLAFINGDYDVLVTTTIIETGVDIPNANTLFVENADRMGLSTLYQLRGRVGRTNRVAFCYYLYQPGKQLSEVSESRLQALRDFTELGSGFKIAMRDLSIRGAGNLLGKQQSGYMNSVGFDMYSEMLTQAVKRKRGQSDEVEVLAPIEIDLKISAYLPESYIADNRQKIEMYKRINRVVDEVEIGELIDEMSDRFGGDIPIDVYNLLDIAEMKIHARQARVITIKRNEQSIAITFEPLQDTVKQTQAIFMALGSTDLKASLGQKNGHPVITFDVKGHKTADWLRQLISYLAELGETISKGDHTNG